MSIYNLLSGPDPQSEMLLCLQCIRVVRNVFYFSKMGEALDLNEKLLTGFECEDTYDIHGNTVDHEGLLPLYTNPNPTVCWGTSSCS